MVSNIQICNMALSQIGDDYTISSFDDEIKTARYSNIFYEPTRDLVLRSYPWRFALKRASVPALAEKPAWGYSAQYQLPVDCLRVWSLRDNTEEFEVEGDKILANHQGALDFLYIKKITDPNLFDTMFVECLVLKLAAKLSVPLKNSTTSKDSFEAAFEKQIREARSASSMEASQKQIEVFNGWVEARL